MSRPAASLTGGRNVAAIATVSALLAAAGLDLPVRAADRRVAPAEGSLSRAIAAAAPGDRLILLPGLHRGGAVIAKRLTVEGLPGAVIDGEGRGTVIRIIAAGVVIRGLTVENSGIRQEEIDSGIFADAGADGALIENNRLRNNEFGISLRGAANAVARDNIVEGRTDLRENERGDGISVWNARASTVLNNDVRFGRDGIRSTASRDNVFAGNQFHQLRYAIHYMWTNGGIVENNISEGNEVGYAIMFSHDLIIRGNLSRRDRAHGLMIDSANHSVIEGNAVIDGGSECVYIYDANHNRFAGNWFQGCPVGVYFTAGSENNQFTGNAFIDNRNQVKYVGTRSLDWSDGGRGNYWSDNPAFDLKGDGIADRPYRPNDIVDRVVWSAPLAKLLLDSPAIAIVRWAQAAFPAVTPGGVYDSKPLMRPPARPVLIGENRL